jgi:hypothetical protein
MPTPFDMSKITEVKISGPLALPVFTIEDLAEFFTLPGMLWEFDRKNRNFVVTVDKTKYKPITKDESETGITIVFEKVADDLRGEPDIGESKVTFGEDIG